MLVRYLKLIRPYGILFLGLMPVFGALANGHASLFHLAILLVIGLLAHVFTFVQNDYFDIEVDKRSQHVHTRPLAAGTLSSRSVLILFLAAFCLSVVLAFFFVFTLPSMLVLFAAFLCMTLYNRYSKRLPGMEYVLGLGVFAYGLFGALTVAGKISMLALIISLVGGLQWIFSVGISANMKDVASDLTLGVRTTPVRLGVIVKDNRMSKPALFIAYAFGLKGVHLSIAAVPFVAGYTSLFIFQQRFNNKKFG